MAEPQYELVLRDIEAHAKENRWPIIGPTKGALLVELIEQYRPMRILELGALVGYSSTLMAAHLPPGGEIVSIEIEPKNVETTRATQQRAGVADRCQVVQGDARETIATLPGPWNMLFVDAAKEAYLDYLKAAEPHLAPGAIVVADNVKHYVDRVAPYLDYVRNSGKYESAYHEFGDDAVEVSRLVGALDG